MTLTYYGVALTYGPKQGSSRAGITASDLRALPGDRPISAKEAIDRAKQACLADWDEGRFGPASEYECIGSVVSICVTVVGSG